MSRIASWGILVGLGVAASSSLAVPVVQLTVPSNQFVGAERSAPILVRFASPMDTTTILPANFIVTTSLRGTIPVSLQWSTATNELTLDPAQDFLVGERVGVTITSGVRDAGGVPLSQGYHFEFSTWSAPMPGGVFVTESLWWPIGSVALNLTVADLNADALPEAIFSNVVADSLTIFSPDGAGGFVPFATLATGILPRHTLAADVDDDGDPDLVCCASGPSQVQVFSNLGNGAFSAAQAFGTGATPYGAYAGDLDADGDLDVATANFTGQSISILRNTGAGSFAPAVNVSAGTGSDSPRWIDGADLDFDGDIDLVCCNGYSDDVSVFLNNGVAGFMVQTPRRTVGDSPNFMEIRDYDGDAIPDIVTVDAQSGTMSFLRGNGNGTFQSAVFSPVGGTLPYGIHVADVDGDLDLDVLVPIRGINGWRVMQNDGSGLFSQGPLYLGGTHCHTIGAADWDADGDLDVVSGFAVSRTMHFYEQALSPSVLATTPPANATGVPSGAPITLSFNTSLEPATIVPAAFVTTGSQSGPGTTFVNWNDGTRQITLTPQGLFFPGEVVSVTATDALAALEGIPFDGFTFSFMTEAQGAAANFAGPTVQLPGSDPVHVTACDFDGDGASDLAIANYLSNDVTILESSVGNVPTLLGVWPVGSGPVDLWCGDVSGDGFPDLVAANLTGSSLTLLRNTGLGGFEPGETLAATGSPVALAAGDFNLDGDTDLVTVGVDPPGAEVFYNDGTGEFPGSVFVSMSSSPNDVAVADLDRDGSLDCIVVDGTNDLVATYAYVSGSGLVPVGSFGTGSSPVNVFPWDLNGDGWIDLVCADFGGGLTFLENVGDGSFAPASILPAEELPHAVWGADFDGDSDLDLVTANSGGSSLSLLRNQGNGVFDSAPPIAVGATPYSITGGDWNGDGTVDIASVNRAAGSLSILLNQAATGAPILGEAIVSTRWVGASPNPFRESTELRFSLAASSGVRLTVFDVQGREVAQILEGRRLAGQHAARWDGHDSRGLSVVAGVYFLRLEANGKSFTDKVLRIR